MGWYPIFTGLGPANLQDRGVIRGGQDLGVWGLPTMCFCAAAWEVPLIRLPSWVPIALNTEPY